MPRRVAFLALFLASGCSDSISPAVSHIRKSPNPPTFTIKILPNLDGNDVRATAFNASGVVTGYRNSPKTVVFRSYPTGIEYYAPPAGYLPESFFAGVPFSAGIDDQNNVVTMIGSDTAFRAVLWYPDDNAKLLQPTYPYLGVGPGLGCGAWAKNNNGYIVGACMPNSNVFATIWAPNGTYTQSCCAVLTAVSPNQYVTGYDETGFTPPKAIIWYPGAATYNTIGASYSYGLAVNQNGFVAGFEWLTAVDSTAALWLKLGMKPLILAPIGVATGIDEFSNVVGYERQTSGGPTSAFLWQQSTGITTALPPLPSGGATGAVAINFTQHVILGWAYDQLGLRHAVLWTFTQ